MFLCMPGLHHSGGLFVSISSEQMETALVPCDLPGWEQSAADLGKSPEGMHLKIWNPGDVWKCLCSYSSEMKQPLSLCMELSCISVPREYHLESLDSTNGNGPCPASGNWHV